jgi:hypothetical protein
MSFIANIGYVLLGCVIIVAIFLVILWIIEKKLKIRLLFGRKTKNEVYIEKVSKTDVNKPQEAIKQLDKIGKAFFVEAFHVQNSADYSELKEFFYKKNNKKAAEFCNIMTQFLYSNIKESITKKDIQKLITLLAEIISSNQILTKKEKEELDKKARQNQKMKQGKKGLMSRLPFFRKK